MHEGQLKQFDELTRQLEEEVEQGEVGLAAGKAAYEKMVTRGDSREKLEMFANKLINLEFNINLLKGLIKENHASRAALVALMNPDLSTD